MLEADLIDLPDLGSILEVDIDTIEEVQGSSYPANTVLLDTGAQLSVSHDIELLQGVHTPSTGSTNLQLQ
jgi:hypothetical protein